MTDIIYDQKPRNTSIAQSEGRLKIDMAKVKRKRKYIKDKLNKLK